MHSLPWRDTSGLSRNRITNRSLRLPRHQRGGGAHGTPRRAVASTEPEREIQLTAGQSPIPPPPPPPPLPSEARRRRHRSNRQTARMVVEAFIIHGVRLRPSLVSRFSQGMIKDILDNMVPQSTYERIAQSTNELQGGRLARDHEDYGGGAIHWFCGEYDLHSAYLRSCT